MEPNFADIFGSGTDLNTEVIFATQISGSIAISDYSGTTFPLWSNGGDTKSDEDPITADLVNAFDAAGDTTRKNATIDLSGPSRIAVKFGSAGAEQDFIELRLADVILLYAEALNENGNSSSAITQLNKIRSNSLTGTVSTQADVRQVIADERRLELAFEGHRWFDLVRTGEAAAKIGMTIDSNYHLFPIPTSEIFASNGVITQNPGY